MGSRIQLLKFILKYSERVGDCLRCNHGLDKDGYSLIWMDGRTYRTHRVIMYLVGDFNLESNLQVLHNDSICSHKNCIEYDHLSVGDASENASTRKEYDNNRRPGDPICSIHKRRKKLNSANRLFCPLCHREAQRRYRRKTNKP